MKEYLSIQHDIVPSQPIIAFDKLDGSNVRVEWNKKTGFTKFGKRNGLLDDSNPHLKAVPELFMAKYAEDLTKVIRDNRWQKVTAFMEFHGPLSFAGNHVVGDSHTVTLFDLAVDTRGFLTPQDFLKTVGHLDIAKVLFQGKASKIFVDSVRDGSLQGITSEGVVCKGAYVRPGQPLMFKIKTDAYLTKLREFCKGDEALFERIK